MKAFVQLFGLVSAAPVPAPPKKRFLISSISFFIVAGTIFAATGCVRVKVDPIHVTMDVNVKVDKALDSFFSDLDAKAAGGNEPAPMPAQK